MGLCSSTASGQQALTKLYDVDETRVLGEGSYSVVFRGVRRGADAAADAVAIKRVDKAKCVSSQQWEDEVALLRQCAHHANIIDLRDVFHTVSGVWRGSLVLLFFWQR